jgi:tRNA threonylcarbamoyladenosine biosynthesis protein TsaB
MNDQYILAVETSSRMGSVAIGQAGRCLGQVEFTAGARHGVELVPAVNKLVEEVHLSPDQIRVICVSCGPGSFTGLRVGFTFARSLAQVTGAKLVTVPSTEVVVENLMPQLVSQPGPVYLAPILDAKRKQVYSAGFRWQGGRLEKVLPECVINPSDLMAALGRPLWITGEGIDYHTESFSGREGVIFTDREFWLGRAENVLKIGTRLAEQDQFTSIHNFIPTYVRLPEAEEKWQLRQAEKQK